GLGLEVRRGHLDEFGVSLSAAVLYDPDLMSFDVMFPVAIRFSIPILDGCLGTTTFAGCLGWFVQLGPAPEYSFSERFRYTGDGAQTRPEGHRWLWRFDVGAGIEF